LQARVRPGPLALLQVSPLEWRFNNMTLPSKKDGSRVCVVFKKGGVTLYGNRVAFAALAEWAAWISRSPENEHYECHVLMDLEDDASKFGKKRPRNAWALIESDIAKALVSRSKHETGVEMTLMCVEEDELDKLAAYQDSQVLPKNADGSQDELE
jgi:hypothetical protein